MSNNVTITQAVIKGGRVRRKAMGDEFVRQLYEKYYNIVFQYCLPKLHFDEQVAADCAHAAFDKAEAKYEKLQNHPNILGWLLRTSKNIIMKQWRSYKILAPKTISLELIAELPDNRDPFDMVELSSDDIDKICERLLSELKPEEHKMYLQYFCEKRTIQEIAAANGISDKAARAKLARIKIKLKEKIIYFM